jgi:hypothetical protein
MASERFRLATMPILGLRVAYGIGLILAPQRLTRRWLGPAVAARAAQVPLRGIGGREVAVHGAALIAALTGGRVRPWLAVSISGDLCDIAATAVAHDDVPDGSVVATLAVAGGSALLTAALAAAVDG